MERGGTGDSLFRNLYREFLAESGALLGSDNLIKASEDYDKIAKLWKNVADLFIEIGETEEMKYVNDASKILIDLSEKEKLAMEKLMTACA